MVSNSNMDNIVRTFEQFKLAHPNGTIEEYRIIEKLVKEMDAIPKKNLEFSNLEFQQWKREQEVLGKTTKKIYDTFIREHIWKK